MKRRPAAAACLVFPLLGLAVGLSDFHRLIQFPVERFTRLQESPPTPRSVFWVRELERPDRFLEAWERPAAVVTLLLLVGALTLLGALLNPGFTLLKPANADAGWSGGRPVDRRRVARAAAAVVVSLWLAGCLAPLGWLVGGRSNLALLAAGGPPAWLSPLPVVPGQAVLSVLLFGLLWWIWGGCGAPPPGGPRRRDVAAWALCAGAAAAPAALALYAGRSWVLSAAPAFSLADREGWRTLMALAAILPTAGMAYLAVLACTLYPRPASRPGLRGAGMLAALLLAATSAAAARLEGTVRGLDLGTGNLARKLNLAPSPFTRTAIILTPRQRAVYSLTEDGSSYAVPGGSGGEGQPDRIACNGESVAAVEKFLGERNYRSHLAFRAFWHLHSCASLDWLTTRSLEVELEMLERAPSPLVAELLREKLAECAITPENRRVLDRIADPEHFTWPQPMGSRWLGLAYKRFGDPERSRRYLFAAQLSREQLGSVLGGIAPLTNGVVRGRVTVLGRKIEAVRIGLVSRENWRAMVGAATSNQWRHVLAAGHTDNQGRFELRDIPEGEYLLVITGGGIGRLTGMPNARPHPGVLRLDRFHPVVTVPAFDLQFVQPGRSPSAPDRNTV